MKILSASQIRELDAYTITHEPISSIDLMERASQTFAQWFTNTFQDVDRPVQVFCGIGNNGGDGLAIGRILQGLFYDVTIYCCQISSKTAPDFDHNLQRLPLRQGLIRKDLAKGDPLPEVPDNSLILDAIFGSGLNRPVTGYWADLLDHLNRQNGTRIAIDMPSGLFADEPTQGTTFHAHYTLSFELPKLSFLFPENGEAVGQWSAQPIGLHPAFLAEAETKDYYLTQKIVQAIWKPRAIHAHKGTYGHALHLMGSQGKIGAAVLAAKACLRSGTGLLTVGIPEIGYSILQTAVPEAMVLTDKRFSHLVKLPDLQNYKVVACGCGLGTEPSTRKLVNHLLEAAECPLVLDADALNIIAMEHWQRHIPPGTIITPHPKEFERLFGLTGNHFERQNLQRAKAQELGIFIVLKGAHTCIATPDGDCYFNSTGNPGMATAGSGDVLTGILSGLLAQGYNNKEAVLLGVYLHGMAGDLAAASSSAEAMIAGDIVLHLGSAFRQIQNS